MASAKTRADAQRHVEIMVERNGGKLPRTVERWVWLAWLVGMIQCYESGEFRGKLVWTARGPHVYYASDATPAFKILIIAHEISEYLSRFGQSSLFEAEFAPEWDGDEDRCHRVADQAARIVAKAMGMRYASVVVPKAPERVWPVPRKRMAELTAADDDEHCM